MTTKAHSLLTGSDLHEPKGVAAATAGQVYISNGSGSGSWTDTGATIGASSFTTGDLKPTIKTTPDSGWIMCDDGTIGDLSSGASNLAAASTQDLYYLLWNNCANAEAAVSTGRGVSASADFTAHKTIALPKMLGRVYGIAGSGSGLTSHVLGKTAGVESAALTQAELPVCDFVVDIPSGQGSHNHSITGNVIISGGGSASAGSPNAVFPASSAIQAATLPQMSGTAASGGSATAVSKTQPTVFLNMMIKL